MRQEHTLRRIAGKPPEERLGFESDEKPGDGGHVLLLDIVQMF